MLKKNTFIIGVLMFIFTLVSIVTIPLKQHNKERIITSVVEDIKTIRYNNDIKIITGIDSKDFKLFNVYKKDILMNGKLNFYGYDIVTGELHTKNVYCARDCSTGSTLIIFYENKNNLKRCIVKLVDKRILYLSEYHYYRLSMFLFGYDKYNSSIKEDWLYKHIINI